MHLDCATDKGKHDAAARHTANLLIAQNYLRSRREVPPSQDLARHVTRAFMDRARHLPGRRVWAASGLESASGTCVLKCPVERRRPIIYERPGRGELSAAKARVDVVFVIVRKVGQ